MRRAILLAVLTSAFVSAQAPALPAPFVVNSDGPVCGRGTPGVTIAELIRTPVIQRCDLLRASAFALRQSSSMVKVTVVAERFSVSGRPNAPADPPLPLKSAAIALFNESGKVVGEWTSDAKTKLTDTLTASFPVAPGRYRARVAALRLDGNVGSADIQVNAALTPSVSGMSLSDVQFASSAAPAVNKLLFTADKEAFASFELYGGKRGMPVSITMDVATSVEGPAIAKLTPKIAGTPEPDKFVVTASIELSALPPADYVVRATVGLDGQPATTITRTLRKAQ